jgi:nucleoside-diphosphate-sugar epimerase
VILVTGAGGLIGSALVQRLRSEGFDVWAPKCARERGDALDLNHVSATDLPAGLQSAFLCAWQGGVAEAARDPRGTRRTNVEGNLELVGRLRQAGTNVIFLSTSLVFSTADTSATTPPAPCCVYGEQKAEVEAGLDVSHDAIVRVTKVGETLMPRLSQWAATLRAGGRVAAAGHLRVAPVMLEEVVEGLAGLARDFEPGIYQMSAGEDHSYLEFAESLALQAGGEAVADPTAGAGVYRPFPASGRLEIAAPSRSRQWPSGAGHAQRLVQSALS